MKDKAILRNIIKTGSDILLAGYDEETPVETILDRIYGINTTLTSTTGKNDLQKID